MYVTDKFVCFPSIIFFFIVCLFPRNFSFWTTSTKSDKFYVEGHKMVGNRQTQFFFPNSNSWGHLEYFHRRICVYLYNSWICDYLKRFLILHNNVHICEEKSFFLKFKQVFALKLKKSEKTREIFFHLRSKFNTFINTC